MPSPTTILLALPVLAVALVTYQCARLTRPDRNYWPMIRVMWGVLCAIYFGSFVNRLLGARGGATVTLAFNLIMLGGVLYARWFMARRNRTPRMFGLRLDGQITMLTTEEIDHAAMIAESAANHGVLPPERVASLEAALAEWHRKRRWQEDARRQVDARRLRKRGGIPDGAGRGE